MTDDAAVTTVAPDTPAAGLEPFLGVARSLGGRRWVARPCDDRTALALSQRLEIPEVLGRVLAARGVDIEHAEGYLAPRLRDLMPDPSTLHDMDAAAARLARAVQGGEGIAVFGDYDVDGATSAALLQRFFDAAGARVAVYIPDRLKEGYGPNTPAMVRLADEGAKVIVTVDCGTSASGPIAAARDAGADVIVVDHHVPGHDSPPAFALVNPNRLDESGALGALAAVGVAFLLVVAVNRTLRAAGWYGAARPEPDLLAWLDLVALGTVCDVVPLTGLNRALVSQGLKVMAARGNAGIAALADVTGLDTPPGTYHVGFVLGPRVNAGGRVGRAGLGARLLATGDRGEAAGIARELDGYNTERRAIEAAVLEEARAQVEAAGDSGPMVFASGEGWHPGVIGIVASRLKEAWRRPSAVVAIDGGIAKGSARSVPGVDLGAAVIAAREAGLLRDGGGHRMAAGFTADTSRLGELAAFLKQRVGSAGMRAPGLHELSIDGAVAAAAAGPDLVALLDAAGPFGAGNPEPRFAVPSAIVVRADVVGEDHVRVILGGGAGGGRLKAIAFRSAREPVGDALLSTREPLHVAGHLRADTWQGVTRAQLVIDDVADPRRSGPHPSPGSG